MLSRIIFVLAATSLAALALRFLGSVDEESLTREAAGNLDALREHLFKR